MRHWHEALTQQSVDPIECYDGLRIPGQPRTPLQTLACRVLTICANSASVERLFSLFGQILSKLRSRLRNEAMVMLAEVKLHIRDGYKWNETVRARLRRHIAGPPCQVPSCGATTLPSTPTVPTPSVPLPSQLVGVKTRDTERRR